MEKSIFLTEAAVLQGHEKILQPAASENLWKLIPIIEGHITLPSEPSKPFKDKKPKHIPVIKDLKLNPVGKVYVLCPKRDCR